MGRDDQSQSAARGEDEGTKDDNRMEPMRNALYPSHRAHLIVLISPLVSPVQDIIHYSWLLDCVKFGRLIPLSKKYVIGGTASTLAALDREVDGFGDSFTQPADLDSLIGSLQECAARYAHPFEGGQQRATTQRAIKDRPLLEQQLNQPNSPPTDYRSAYLQLTTDQQRAIQAPTRAFVGMELWVHGKKESDKHTTRRVCARITVYVSSFLTSLCASFFCFSSPGLDLCLTTVRLLGGRITPVLHAPVTHILRVETETETTASATATAIAREDGLSFADLHAVMNGFGVTIIEASEEATIRPAEGICHLITMEWIEQQRQKQTEEIRRRQA